MAHLKPSGRDSSSEELFERRGVRWRNLSLLLGHRPEARLNTGEIIFPGLGHGQVTPGKPRHVAHAAPALGFLVESSANKAHGHIVAFSCLLERRPVVLLRERASGEGRRGRCRGYVRGLAAAAQRRFAHALRFLHSPRLWR